MRRLNASSFVWEETGCFHRTLFYLLNRLEVTVLAERMECPWCCLTTKFLSQEVDMWLALIEFHLFQMYWPLDIIKSAALLCLGENKT